MLRGVRRVSRVGFFESRLVRGWAGARRFESAAFVRFAELLFLLSVLSETRHVSVAQLTEYHLMALLRVIC